MKLILLFCLSAYLIFLAMSSAKSRTLLFWISLMFFVDSGGFFSGYLGSDIIWRIKYYDFFFGFMLIAYFFNTGNQRLILQDPAYFRIIRYLIFISLYFLFITGIIIPMVKGYSNMPFFLQKSRLFFYAIPLFIMTYSFARDSIQIFYKVIIVFSVIILVSFMVTLLTPINIVPVYTFNRYGEGDRLSMVSYGLIDWIVPMGIIYLATGKSLRIPNSKFLLLSFALMLLTMLLTLTRREFLRIIFMAIVIPFLLSKINKTIYIKKYLKFIFPTLGLILLILILFPRYIDLSLRLLNDTFHLVTTGKDTQGVEDYRVTGSGDLGIVKGMITQNPLFGIGYYPASWKEILEMKRAGSQLALAIDAGGEVPIYGALMTLGAVGIIVPCLLYFYLFILWNKIYRVLRSNYHRFLKYPVELLILLTLTYYLLARVTLEIYGLFGEFYSGYGMTNFAVLLGIWLGVFQVFRLNIFTSDPSSKLDLTLSNFN